MEWPAITTEEVPWQRSDDEWGLIPKSRRRFIKPTYQASIPAPISNLHPIFPPEITERLADLRSRLARFDEQQQMLPFNLPSILLRSESAASSQIENLTASARNIALAELSPTAPKNAQTIAGNIAAMRHALNINSPITPQIIQEIHYHLMNSTNADFAGQLRNEQVWVGGSAYSPHEALFVPPVAKRVPGCLDDLCAFIGKDSLDPIAKAAIAHGQFETIHPFIDGNGRTGRTLFHQMLRNDETLCCATAPLSAGLLHDIDAYMQSIRNYQAGDPIPLINQLADALELAMIIGKKTSTLINEVLVQLHEVIHERAGSKIFDLPNLLVEQPVVDSSYVANALNVSRRSATSIINRACEYGILRPIGNARRGEFYQADDIIDVIEQISSIAGIRRLMAQNSN